MDAIERRKWAQAGVWVAIACSVVLSCALRADSTVNHDVSWFVVAADRMLKGGSYARDFFEVNMPLAIAAYVPIHWIANSFHWEIPQAVDAWLYFLLSLSLMLSWRALCPPSDAPRLPHVLALTWLAVMLVVFPGYDFAEREHITVLLVLPFVLAVAKDPLQFSLGFRISISVLAAMGCFMKPHYAALPFALLLLRVRHSTLRSALFGVEGKTLAIAASLNALLVKLLAPDWFVAAGWAVDLYDGYQGSDPWRLVQGQSAVISLCASALLLVLAFAVPKLRRVALPFVVATAYSWFAFVVQGTGWRYHLLPAAMFAVAAFPAIWLSVNVEATATARLRAAHALFASLSVVAILHLADIVRGLPKLSLLADSSIGEALSISRPGDSLYVFSTAAVPFFPAITHLKLDWASRYSALWPLPALGRYELENGARALAMRQQYKQPFIHSVITDFRRFRPDIVIVDLRPGQFGLPTGFDLVGYFQQSPRFTREWERYVELGRSRDYAIYVRTPDVPPQ